MHGHRADPEFSHEHLIKQDCHPARAQMAADKEPLAYREFTHDDPHDVVRCRWQTSRQHQRCQYFVSGTPHPRSRLICVSPNACLKLGSICIEPKGFICWRVIEALGRKQYSLYQ